MDASAWLWQPLENPWPVAVGLVVLGLIARQAFAAAGSRAGMRASWMIALSLAVGLVAAARAVTTPREELMQLTRGLVHAVGGEGAVLPGGDAAVGSVDLATIKRTVDEGAWIVGPDGEELALFRMVVRRLDDIVERYGVTGQAIRRLDAEAGRNAGVSVVRVSTQSQGGLPPINSAWRLSWRRDVAADRWVVEELRLLEVNNQSPTRGMLP